MHNIVMCQFPCGNGILSSVVLDFVMVGPICNAQLHINSYQPRSQARDFLGYTKESHRACYLKSRAQLTTLSPLKESCVSLHSTGEFASVVSLGLKQALKKATGSVHSLAIFIRCLRIASVLAHAHYYHFTTCTFLLLASCT